MLNETIVETLNAITPTGVVWWMKLLAICGFIWLLQTLFKTGIVLVYVIAYIIGFFKWIIKKIQVSVSKRKED